MRVPVSVYVPILTLRSAEGTTIPATSTVGTAVSVNSLFMPREVDTLTFIVNNDCSKCVEQRTDEREGVKCGRNKFFEQIAPTSFFFQALFLLRGACV